MNLVRPFYADAIYVLYNKRVLFLVERIALAYFATHENSTMKTIRFQVKHYYVTPYTNTTNYNIVGIVWNAFTAETKDESYIVSTWHGLVSLIFLDSKHKVIKFEIRYVTYVYV